MQHGWFFTKQLRVTPQRCAVFPHIHSDAYIDTGMDIPGRDPHVYIGTVAATELGKAVGMVPGGEVRRVEAELALERGKVEILQEQVEKLERFKSAVDLVKAEI
jgi:hypothetical protein